MPSSHDEDLAFAIQLAERAGELLTASYERVMRVDRKSRRDVVTDVDYASEALVIEAIRARYPDDAILAEESGRHERMAGDGGGGRRRDARARWSRRTWVIDPLDGTVNYANGIPFFCVSIGLVEDGQAGRRRRSSTRCAATATPRRPAARRRSTASRSRPATRSSWATAW